MKQLFKEGKFVVEHYMKVLKLYSTDPYAEANFRKSKNYIYSSLGEYDFDNIEDTEYYYMYKATGENSLDGENVRKSILNLLDGNWDNVINKVDLSIGHPDETLENDIFWDVNNNIIIAKGKENIYQMCVELYMYGYEKFGTKRNQEIDDYCISTSLGDVKILRKAYDLLEEDKKYGVK